MPARSLRHLATLPALAGALGLAALAPAALAAQDQQQPPKKDEPLTPRTVGENVADETKRVYKRSEKAVRKAGKQTEKQARRTGKQAKRVVSREERERQEAEKRAGTP